MDKKYEKLQSLMLDLECDKCNICLKDILARQNDNVKYVYINIYKKIGDDSSERHIEIHH